MLRGILEVEAWKPINVFSGREANDWMPFLRLWIIVHTRGFFVMMPGYRLHPCIVASLGLIHVEIQPPELQIMAFFLHMITDYQPYRPHFIA